VELDPNDATAWRNLGFARSRQKNYVGAEEAFTRTVELDPKDATAWRNLGSARGRQENHVGAEEAFTRTVELDPKDATGWLSLAVCCYKNYSFVRVAKNLIMSLEIDEKEMLTYGALCELYLLDNLLIEPLSTFEKALSIEDATNEFKAYIRFLRAMVFLHKNDRTPFLTDLQAGLKLVENTAEEARRSLLGNLIEFLVGITFPHNLEEIRTYTNALKQVSPELASVLDPLHYVLDYFQEYFSKVTEKKKGVTAIRAQRILDNIPSELRGPVEEMVQEVKKNILWWEKRPK
jgi:tetratricopeptide (TPR) repeat protein